MSETARLKSTVYVGGLDQAVSGQTLAEAFIPFGEIVDVTIPKPDAPSSTDLHRGFGYVEFEVPGDAKEAIDNMDGSELFGRTIKVAAAKPQKDSNEGLGSKTAIWQQVCAGLQFPLVQEKGSNLINYLWMYRRVTWRNTPSARKTNLRRSRHSRKRPKEPRTLCKGWSNWMLQVRSLNE